MEDNRLSLHYVAHTSSFENTLQLNSDNLAQYLVRNARKVVAGIINPEVLFRPVVMSHRRAPAEFDHLPVAMLAATQPRPSGCLSPSV